MIDPNHKSKITFLMKSLLLVIFTLLFIQASRSQNEKKTEVTILNLSESFSQLQEAPLSRFVDKISYIPLETNPEIVLGQTARFEVTDDFIYVKNAGLGQKTQLLLFDRNTGKFIREIGKSGRGPGEYYSTSSLPFNPSGKEFYATGVSNEILVYDLFGKYIDKIKPPEWIDTKSPYEFQSRISSKPFNRIDSKTFVGYIHNFNGWENRKMVLFTKEKIIKIFPNYQTFTRKDFKTTYSPAGGYFKFYNWDNKLYFIETFCDTLYQVTKDELLPRYFFDSGKFRALYSKQFDIMSGRQTPDYFFITDIDENKDYIFIKLNYALGKYTGFIEKKTNKITFCKKDISGASGLKDDINGLMVVVPKDFTQKNEMVYLIQPSELFKWFKANPEKAASARNKLPWLKDIDELSNPVIAIAKCKA
jgi:hypothetical protein